MRGARTARSSSLIGFFELARELNLDPERIARHAGVPPEALFDPNLRVPVRALGQMLMDAAALSGANDIGLRFGRARRLSHWGLLGLVAREQPTLGDILKAVRRYMRLHSDAVWIELLPAGDKLDVHLNFYEPMPAPMLQTLSDLSLAGLYLSVRELMGGDWSADCICFRYARPAAAAAYEEVFGCEVAFEQAFDGLVVPLDALQRPSASATTGLAQHIEAFADRQLGVGRVADALAEFMIRQLPEGRCTIELAAAEMGMGVRTLQRRLAEEHTSFAEVLDSARDILAQSYVDGSRRALVEVSTLLGFGSQAAFNHWYRARHGISPSERRRQVAARTA